MILIRVDYGVAILVLDYIQTTIKAEQKYGVSKIKNLKFNKYKC